MENYLFTKIQTILTTCAIENKTTTSGHLHHCCIEDLEQQIIENQIEQNKRNGVNKKISKDIVTMTHINNTLNRLTWHYKTKDLPVLTSLVRDSQNKPHRAFWFEYLELDKNTEELPEPQYLDIYLKCINKKIVDVYRPLDYNLAHEYKEYLAKIKLITEYEDKSIDRELDKLIHKYKEFKYKEAFGTNDFNLRNFTVINKWIDDNVTFLYCEDTNLPAAIDSYDTGAIRNIKDMFTHRLNLQLFSGKYTLSIARFNGDDQYNLYIDKLKINSVILTKGKETIIPDFDVRSYNAPNKITPRIDMSVNANIEEKIYSENKHCGLVTVTDKFIHVDIPENYEYNVTVDVFVEGLSIIDENLNHSYFQITHEYNKK